MRRDRASSPDTLSDSICRSPFKKNLRTGIYEAKKDLSVYHCPVLTIALSILLGLFQTAVPQTGTVVGIVKLPDASNKPQAARVALLPAKYIEVWNKQVQQRLDNYWEIFKPELAVNRDRFADLDRMAHVEAFRYITSTMRREMGESASKLITDASANGQFEFRGVPFGTYQLLVQATFNGQDVVWSKALEVQTDIPIFVDLGKPVS